MSLKKCITTHIFLIDFKMISEESSKTIFLNSFVNQKILLKFMKYFSPPAQRDSGGVQ